MATKEVKLTDVKSQQYSFQILGKSPMISHNWDEKATRMMREKKAGKKTKTRIVCDPEREFEAAKYRTAEGEDGFSAMAFKSSLISAAHKDLGVEKTLVRKAIFIVCSDPGLIVPFKFQSCVCREDHVRVGVGSADLRYRPEYQGWSAVLSFEVDTDLLTLEDLANLINRAGFSVGIGDWRPEKGGEFGRFELDREFGFQVMG